MTISSRLHWFLLALVVGLSSYPAAASPTYLIGGQLTYEHVAGNQYLVRCTLYGDITHSSLFAAGAIQLSCRADGCAGADVRNFSVAAPLIGRPQTSALFPLSSFLYEQAVFEVVVELPPANWTLSIAEPNRIPTDNLVDAQLQTLYLAATANTLLAPGNSSPQFYDLPIPQLPWQRHVTYAMGGADAEGDSITYQLVPPLFDSSPPASASCGQPVSYALYEAGQIEDPATGQLFDYPAGLFSAEFPLVSLLPTYPTDGTPPTVVPNFQFNKTTGAIAAFLAPTRTYRPTRNYPVAVRADEYRAIAGVYQKIGSVTREVNFINRDPTDNHPPTFTELRVNADATPRDLNSPILVAAGQPVTLHFTATDPDPDQRLHYYADAAMLPGAVLTPTAAGTTFQWQPTTLTRPGFYRFLMTVVDDYNPLSNFETRIVTLRVVNTVLASKARQPLRGAAYPAPFTDQVTIQLPTPGRQRLTVLDALGRTVAALVSQPDGTVVWRPAAAVALGAYFVRTAGGTVARLLRTAN